MRTGKVITLSIGGLRNKIHNFGDVVNEEQFVAGRFSELVENGAIELTSEDDKPANFPAHDEVVITIKETEEEEPQGIKEAKERNKEELKNEPTDPVIIEEKIDLDDTTRQEIMSKLDEAKVKYNKNESKHELYERWRKSKK